jgi:tyrosyl-tRNA synthetase
VWLDPRLTSPYDYYQYWRNTEDADVGRFLRMFTFMPLDEIAELERLEGADLNRAKEVLAFEATKITHGEEEARSAQETAHARFGGGGLDTGPAFTVRRPTSVVDLAVETGLAESKNAAKRHIQGGGLRINEERVDSSDRMVDPAELPALLSVGKRKVRLVAD